MNGRLAKKLLVSCVLDNWLVLACVCAPGAFWLLGFPEQHVLVMCEIVMVVLFLVLVGRAYNRDVEHLRRRDEYAAEWARIEAARQQKLRKVYTSLAQLLAGVDNGSVTDEDLRTAVFALDCTEHQLMQPGVNAAMKAFLEDDSRESFLMPLLTQEERILLLEIIQHREAHLKVVDAVIAAGKADSSRVRWSAKGHHYEVEPAA